MFCYWFYFRIFCIECVAFAKWKGNSKHSSVANTTKIDMNDKAFGDGRHTETGSKPKAFIRMIIKISLRNIHVLSLSHSLSGCVCEKYNIRCEERLNHSIDFCDSTALSFALSHTQIYLRVCVLFSVALSIYSNESHKIGHQYIFNNIVYTFWWTDQPIANKKGDKFFFACHRNIKEFQGIDFDHWTLARKQTKYGWNERERRTNKQMMKECEEEERMNFTSWINEHRIQ